MIFSEFVFFAHFFRVKDSSGIPKNGLGVGLRFLGYSEWPDRRFFAAVPLGLPEKSAGNAQKIRERFMNGKLVQKKSTLESRSFLSNFLILN
ncbi:MAG: hypothetical protein ACOVQQ_05180 [Flavobacterium sp.]